MQLKDLQYTSHVWKLFQLISIFWRAIHAGNRTNRSVINAKIMITRSTEEREVELLITSTSTEQTYEIWEINVPCWCLCYPMQHLFHQERRMAQVDNYIKTRQYNKLHHAALLGWLPNNRYTFWNITDHLLPNVRPSDVNSDPSCLIRNFQMLRAHHFSKRLTGSTQSKHTV